MRFADSFKAETHNRRGKRVPVIDKVIGNLSTDVFEPRTSTGSWIFPSLERFDAIAFVMSNRKHKNKSFAVHGKEQNHAKKENIRLPVAVRGSKTSVLKFPNGIYIPHFLYVYIQMRFTFKSCARVRSDISIYWRAAAISPLATSPNPPNP